MKKKRYVSAEHFHDGQPRIYDGDIGWAVNKRSRGMARVVYEAVHKNASFPEGDERRGAGRDYAKWVFSEEPGTAEGLLGGGFELLIDAKLEPDAAIGLHWHLNTEEIYYLLKGNLRMTTVSRDGAEHTVRLGKGDSHAVRKGQGHYGRAGPNGARFIAVAFLA